MSLHLYCTLMTDGPTCSNPDRKTFYYSVEKGSQFSTTVQKLETDLTVELLNSYVAFHTSYTHLSIVLIIVVQGCMGESFVQEVQL